MDIKEIALKAGYSTVPAYWLSDEKPIACSTSNLERLVSFAEALIAEIAKQNEPLCTAAMLDEWFLSKSGVDPKLLLYTIPPTASQIEQETVEACAKACEDVIGNTPHDQRMLAAIDCAVMLRSGAWKEFKK